MISLITLILTSNIINKLVLSVGVVTLQHNGQYLRATDNELTTLYCNGINGYLPTEQWIIHPHGYVRLNSSTVNDVYFCAVQNLAHSTTSTRSFLRFNVSNEIDCFGDIEPFSALFAVINVDRNTFNVNSVRFKSAKSIAGDYWIGVGQGKQIFTMNNNDSLLHGTFQIQSVGQHNAPIKASLWKRTFIEAGKANADGNKEAFGNEQLFHTLDQLFGRQKWEDIAGVTRN
eukprot:536133_1